jgi:hypothetical protein
MLCRCHVGTRLWIHSKPIAASIHDGHAWLRGRTATTMISLGGPRPIHVPGHRRGAGSHAGELPRTKGTTGSHRCDVQFKPDDEALLRITHTLLSRPATSSRDKLSFRVLAKTASNTYRLTFLQTGAPSWSSVWNAAPSSLLEHEVEAIPKFFMCAGRPHILEH